MGKNLVIVESPAKAKTINKILGHDYVVKASMGHVRDLPEKDFGIDVEHGFKPKYVNIKSREKVLKELKGVADSVENVYLAPDPDREGEAIAWHLMTALKGKVPEDRFWRVTYNEITAPAIRKAFSEPGHINGNKVDSQQARRVLDRLVGYMVSPLLWRRIRGASSAGRVQSVALRLVCERERDILNFKPEEYWLLGARVRKQVDPRDPFAIRLSRVNGEKAEIRSGAQAEDVRKDLDGRSFVVKSVATKQVSKRAMPPYITSSLQQAGSSVCGFTPSHTMRIAQKLYEGVDFGEGPVGLITYMRTDSFNISKEAQASCRGYIEHTYGKEYLPDAPNVYRSRGTAQEAHEAIRPTDVNRTPDRLKSVLAPEELRLYRLIWERFVASQMAPARISQRLVEIDAPAKAGGSENTYLFRASASEVVFPGYMAVTGVESKKKDDDKKEDNGEEEVEKLPQLAEGEPLDWLEWLQEQKFTQPPPRFTEASLVKALEENGVGRPSTYAQILSTLQTRKYVEKEKKALKPTIVGMQVNDFLVAHLGELFDVKFTAGMEELLDEVEEGKVKWVDMMEKFYSEFLVWVQKAKGPPADKGKVKQLLDILNGVQTWGPETKRGNRTYSDARFVESIRKQLDSEKDISDRQMEALKRLVARYLSQLPGVESRVEELGLTDAIAAEKQESEPPREDTLKKLELLKAVQYAEPRTVGKKTYDDRVFVGSLREQAESGKRLSPNQIRYLDRLFVKYGNQIADFDRLAGELNLHPAEHGNDTESGPLLDLMKNVKEWKPAVQRGNREWDDHKFYESLSRQFGQKKRLSPKQVASLKKLIARYAPQIPDIERVAEPLGIPLRRRKESADPQGE